MDTSHSERRPVDAIRVASRWSALGVSRFSEVQFLVLLLLLFITAPLVEGLPDGSLIEAGVLTAVLISAVVAVGGRRRSLIAAILLVVPAGLGRWAHHYRPDIFAPAAYLGPTVIFGAFVVAHHLWFILRAPEVDARVLCAGISTYLMLGLQWAFLYVLIGSLNPDAFSFSSGPAAARTMSGFTAFYFSFVTLSTTGYGDITPLTSVARMAAVMESIAGTFYMAILLSRLVSLHTARGLKG